MPNCKTNLLGIKLVYCDGSGDKQEVWVDLNRVHALAWCSEEVKAKAGSAGGNAKLPEDKNGPGDCKPTMDDPGAALCWWDGSKWICGVE